MLLTDLKNTFYEFRTLFHCFNDCSLDCHIVIAQNALHLPLRARKRALHQLRCQLHSVEGRAKNVKLFLNFLNSSLVHALLDKAVNK